MLAVYNTARGAAVDTLSIQEIDVPAPMAGQVLVAIKASGINPSDSKLRGGAQGPMVADKVLVHNDGAGVIEAVGSDIDARRVGQRVWLYNVNRSSDGLGQGVNGTAAQYVCVSSDLAIELPEPATFEQGACIVSVAWTTPSQFSPELRLRF
ncbi:alcohol dehydrogenase catalytic domain-containing protein, partial [Pseudosulfitobacter sp. DSM 107133]|uniref:alcohol dehydrogenase catalytic domain-containing protein n=1 Tax=Pseudosulfitobacter sp. DSM 107133 TaxID=2883100 RepID=UPI0013B41B71